MTGKTVLVSEAVHEKILANNAAYRNEIERLRDQLRETQADLDSLREGLKVEWGNLVAGIGPTGRHALRFEPSEDEAHAHATADRNRAVAFRYTTAPQVYIQDHQILRFA
jgi:hypothetical protein